MGPIADLVVDVAVAEQAVVQLLPLPLAEPPLDAALAMDEARAYLGLQG
jgi:hypothetical protein